MPAITKDTMEAAERVRKYLSERTKMSGLDQTEIHCLHACDDREALLNVADLRALVEHITDTAATQAAPDLRAAIETVCEGWTLPAGARKLLEAALWAEPQDGLVNPPSRAEPASQLKAKSSIFDAPKVGEVVKVRIKRGAVIFQDHRGMAWPNCLAPRGMKVDPEMDFDGVWKGSYWDCTAHGFGKHVGVGGYGCGSIFVHKAQDVHVVEPGIEASGQPVPRAGRNAQPDSTTDLAPTDLSAVEVPPLPEPEYQDYGRWYDADHMTNFYREGYAAGRASMKGKV